MGWACTSQVPGPASAMLSGLGILKADWDGCHLYQTLSWLCPLATSPKFPPIPRCNHKASRGSSQAQEPTVLCPACVPLPWDSSEVLWQVPMPTGLLAPCSPRIITQTSVLFLFHIYDPQVNFRKPGPHLPHRGSFPREGGPVCTPRSLPTQSPFGVPVLNWFCFWQIQPKYQMLLSWEGQEQPDFLFFSCGWQVLTGTWCSNGIT